MKENLSYLFLSGIILGSGPCLSFCAPFLIVYTAAQKRGLLPSLCSYGIFSLGRLASYVLWGLIGALGAATLQSEIVSAYAQRIYVGLGFFIVLLGLATGLSTKNIFTRTCSVLTQGNVRNVGVAGLLVGLSPCLPLVGILNYVILIARNPWDAMMYLCVFGLGTIFSPLVFLTMISGQLAQTIAKDPRIRVFLQYACAVTLVLLGIRIILASMPTTLF